MSCSITSVFTFKIESTFDEWAAIFDSAEADKRHSEFDIKPLFRGVSKDDPQKIITDLGESVRQQALDRRQASDIQVRLDPPPAPIIRPYTPEEPDDSVFNEAID